MTLANNGQKKEAKTWTNIVKKYSSRVRCHWPAAQIWGPHKAAFQSRHKPWPRPAKTGRIQAVLGWPWPAMTGKDWPEMAMADRGRPWLPMASHGRQWPGMANLAKCRVQRLLTAKDWRLTCKGCKGVCKPAGLGPGSKPMKVGQRALILPNPEKEHALFRYYGKAPEQLTVDACHVTNT